MKIHTNPKLISSDVQSCIDTPTIPLIRTEVEEEKSGNIMNIKTHQNTASAASETYNLNTATFKNVKPEELLALMKNFKTTADETVTTFTSVSIKLST